MPADVRPFPWGALPRVRRRDARLAAVLADLVGASGRARVDVPGIGALVLAAGPPVELARPALAARLSDPTSAVIAVRAAGQAGLIVVPGRLVRALAQRLLGGPDELDAPRAPTPAERGALTYAAAAVADAVAPAAQVEPVESSGPLLVAERPDGAIVVEIEVTGAAQGALAALVPAGVAVARRHRALADLIAARGAWLGAPVELPAVIATAGLGAGDLASLEVRDVLVVDRVGPAGAARWDRARLRIARGWIPTRLAPDASGLIVIADYERGTLVQETLGDDATVEIDVAAGSVTMPVRRLLELAPGHVLPLNRPLGGPVELRVGARVVGRGELVDVDGELGVRVVAMEDAG